jgi:hypothetical protein
LNATAIERCGGEARRLQAAMAIGEQQHGVTMHRPETAQQIQRRIRQGYKTVFIALGVTNMDALTFCIEVTHLQT